MKTYLTFLRTTPVHQLRLDRGLAADLHPVELVQTLPPDVFLDLFQPGEVELTSLYTSLLREHTDLGLPVVTARCRSYYWSLELNHNCRSVVLTDLAGRPESWKLATWYALCYTAWLRHCPPTPST